VRPRAARSRATAGDADADAGARRTSPRRWRRRAQCAGNRRNEFTRKVRKVKGVGWEAGALSTGLFAGARLRDVLASAGVLPPARHVAFEGDDNCIEEMFGLAFYFKYQTSIPISKAM